MYSIRCVEIKHNFCLSHLGTDLSVSLSHTHTCMHAHTGTHAHIKTMCKHMSKKNSFLFFFFWGGGINTHISNVDINKFYMKHKAIFFHNFTEQVEHTNLLCCSCGLKQNLYETQSNLLS